MHIRLKFGHTTVTFLADTFVPWDDKLQAFAAPGDFGASDLIYTIRLADKIYLPDKTPIRQTRFFSVYEQNGLEGWYFKFPDGQIYAACIEEGNGHFSICYLSDCRDFLAGNATLFYLSTMEYRLLKKHNFILHSSFIMDEGRAILFSGPSGTGKSTQAHLWEDTRGSRIINGDRALMVRENEWLACGWPMSGSSGICENRSLPIRSVVLLSQSAQNDGYMLSPDEAYEQLKQAVVLRSWQQTDIQTTALLLKDFCKEIPVYFFKCRKDPSAVSALSRLIL